MATNKTLEGFDIKTTPEDNDILIEYDKTSNRVKNITMNGVWNWIIKKLTKSAVTDLNTTSKFIVGAINELKAKFDRVAIAKDDLISNLHNDITVVQCDCAIKNNVISIYTQIKVANQLAGPSTTGISIMTYSYTPITKYKICTFTHAESPFLPLTTGASYWIDSSGVVHLYGTLPAGNYYMASEYVIR